MITRVDTRTIDGPLTRFAGLNGQRLVLFAYVNGERRIVGECDSLDDAVRLSEGREAALYFRNDRKHWIQLYV